MELNEDELELVTGGTAEDPSGYQISERMRP